MSCAAPNDGMKSVSTELQPADEAGERYFPVQKVHSLEPLRNAVQGRLAAGFRVTCNIFVPYPMYIAPSFTLDRTSRGVSLRSAHAGIATCHSQVEMVTE